MTASVSVARALTFIAGFAGCVRSASGPNIDPRGEALPANAIWLDTLDLGHMTTGRGRARSGQTPDGNPLRIGGVAFARGIGTYTDGEMSVELGGEAVRFISEVGVDDQIECLASRDAPPAAAARFRVFADGKLVADSDVVGFRSRPKRLEADLRGVRTLRLTVEKQAGAGPAPVDWGGAVIVLGSANSLGPTSRAPRPDSIGQPAEAAAATVKLFNEDETRWIETGRGPEHGAWLETMARTSDDQLPESMSFQHTPDRQPLMLGTRRYGRGLGAHGDNELHIELDGSAKRFFARVGVDGGFQCAKLSSGAGARFVVAVDGRRAFDSEMRRGQDDPIDVSLDLTGARRLTLLTQMNSKVAVNATWAGPVLVLDPTVAAQPRIVVVNPEPDAAAARPPE